jgi:hypothetical protein
VLKIGKRPRNIFHIFCFRPFIPFGEYRHVHRGRSGARCTYADFELTGLCTILTNRNLALSRMPWLSFQGHRLNEWRSRALISCEQEMLRVPNVNTSRVVVLLIHIKGRDADAPAIRNYLTWIFILFSQHRALMSLLCKSVRLESQSRSTPLVCQLQHTSNGV